MLVNKLTKDRESPAEQIEVMGCSSIRTWCKIKQNCIGISDWNNNSNENMFLHLIN